MWARHSPADPVDAVDKKPVGFLPMARYRESGKIAASSHVGTVIDNPGVELQKPVEASSIQRQVFDLLLGDQSRCGTQCRVHQRSFFADRDLLRGGSDFQGQ